MRIIDVRTMKLAVAIPEARRWRNEAGTKVRHEAAIVLVETDEGLVGYGEAKGAPPVIETIVEHRLRPMLIGKDPHRIEFLWELMYSGPRVGLALADGRSYPMPNLRGEVLCAMSAIDVALWDLLGKSLELPVHQLLGGGVREKVRGYASGGWAPAGKAADEALSYTEQGYTALKVRVGGMDGEHFPRPSLDRLHEIRAAVGPDVDIMMDAHGALPSWRARELARGAEEIGIRWFEEPVTVSEDGAGLTEVRASTAIPIATGESEQTRYAFASMLVGRRADILQPDLAIAGGITESRRIAALAHAHAAVVELHNWGSAVLWAASMQFIAATPNCTMIEMPQCWNPLFDDLLTTPVGVDRDGHCAVSKLPGLGIELQPDIEERFAWT